MRWLIGIGWKCFILDSTTELAAMLECLEPYERHFDEKTRTVNLLLYRAKDAIYWAETDWPCLPKRDESLWLGYTFRKREKDMSDMVSDIESAQSVYKNEAVPKLIYTVRLPNSALKSKEGRVIVIRQIDVPVTMLGDTSVR